MAEEEGGLLVERDEYLANGLHIGTKSSHRDMDKYIFHVKKNQLAVLDLDQTDERIREAAKFLAGYDPENVLVVGRKQEAAQPIKVFADATGVDTIIGRFMPGTLTNPNSEEFMEPEVILVTDPEEDAQAIDEAVDAKIPVVAIADSGNTLENIDMAIPANNKAKNALAMIYYLLAREMLKAREEELEYDLDDFKPEEQEK